MPEKNPETDLICCKCNIPLEDGAMPEKNPETDLICCKCNIPLEVGKVYFSYLGHNFSHDLPRCPQCGQIYLSEELVRGKVTEVETTLEDK